MASLTWERTCARCKVPFREVSNLGNWACRYHPGFLQEKEFDGFTTEVWTCCGISPEPKTFLYDIADYDKNPKFDYTKLAGCKRCDHCCFSNGHATLKIAESDWPETLRTHLYEEMQEVLNGRKKPRPGMHSTTINGKEEFVLWRVEP